MDCKRTSQALVLVLLLLFFPLQGVEILDDQGLLTPPARAIVNLYGIEGEASAILHEVRERFMQTGKECWEFEPQFVANEAELNQLFKELGCIDQLEATLPYYDYALVLGALGSRMAMRVDHLYQEWQRGVRFDAVVLLSGDRPLNPALESYPEGMESEMELLIHLIETHPLRSLFGEIPIIAVDAPKVTGRGRPTTASTVCEWLQQHPQPANCLAISNQPYVGYQESVLRAHLPSSFQVEGVGPSVQGTPSPAILLDNFAKWLHYASLKQQ